MKHRCLRLGRPMKQIPVFVIAATMAKCIGAMTFSAGGADDESSPIFGIKIPPGIPRLEVDLRGPRRRQPQRSARHSGQRRRDQGLPGRASFRSRTARSLPGSPGATTRWRKAAKPLAVPKLGWPGHPRTAFSSWSRTHENTPRPAAGASLNLTTANPPARRCKTPAFPATQVAKSRDFVFNRYSP